MNKTVANSVWASRLLHTDHLSEKQMFCVESGMNCENWFITGNAWKFEQGYEIIR